MTNSIFHDLTAPNALGETGVLRERWLRQVFQRAVYENHANTSDSETFSDEATTLSGSAPNLDQDAAMALLKEINADLATARIRQKMAVSNMSTFLGTTKIAKAHYILPRLPAVT